GCRMPTSSCLRSAARPRPRRSPQPLAAHDLADVLDADVEGLEEVGRLGLAEVAPDHLAGVAEFADHEGVVGAVGLAGQGETVEKQRVLAAEEGLGAEF